MVIRTQLGNPLREVLIFISFLFINEDKICLTAGLTLNNKKLPLLLQTSIFLEIRKL